MTSRILDGKAVAAKVEDELKPIISSLRERGITPGLVAVLVGNDPASAVYVRNKARKAVELGLNGVQERYPETITEKELLAVIHRLNADETVHGILIQLPLPKHIDTKAIISAVDPAKDVDGFHPINVGKLHLGESTLPPCTPAGVMRLLEATGEPLAGKHAVVIGRSQIVGRPVATMLLDGNATVTMCHSRTRNLEQITRQADIIVSAVGIPLYVTAAMVREGSIVIDVGINRVEKGSPDAQRIADPGKLRLLNEKGSVLVGDVDFGPVSEKAAWITPVPGGVGPLTIAMLMRNTVFAARERKS